jgi:MoxR-like ATPase
VHIEREAELQVLATAREGRDAERRDLAKVTRAELLAARRAVEGGVTIHPGVEECLVDVSRALRADARVVQGNSTRSLVLLLPALQARACLRGRDYASTEDLEALLPRVLGHRVELAPEAPDFDEVLRDALREPLERLTRATLRRGA